MTTIDAIYGRRAVRDFTDDPIPEETIRDLIDAAIQAPSAMNCQPWGFVVVQDKDLLKEISDRALNEIRSQDLPASLQRSLERPGFNIFYNAGTLIVICAKAIGMHPDWDCCFAAENLLLAARERHLGTCVIGFAWTVLSEQEVRTRLGIPREYEPILAIVVGHTTEFPESPGRADPEIVSWLTPLSV